jgi:putative DNA primase/helicase
MLKETFGNEKRWVNYKLENRDGKLQKIPYNEHKNKNASSTNEYDWYTYDEVKSKSENIGIVFTPDKKLVGIDIDKCIVDGEIQHEHADLINSLIEQCNTYTEYSVSGTGLHLYLYTNESFDLLTNRKDIWEIYNVGRFFATVEKPYKEYNIDIRHVNHDELNKLLSITGYPWGRNDNVSTPVFNYSTSTTLTDQDVLNIMFNSKINGDKIKSLYNTTGGKGSSEDDMKLCSHLAFYCDGYDQIERIWLSSPLGSRDKTKKRKDYREDTINKAMKLCTKHYTPTERTIVKKEFTENMKEDELELLYVTDKNDKKITVVNTENIVRVLKYHPEFKGKLRYDKFKNALEIFRNNKWEEMLDHESINIQTRISVLFSSFLKVSKTMVEDALNKVIHDNEIRSVPDFIKSLKWDRLSRLDSWLTHAFGTANDEYHKSIGSNWMKGMVNRAMNPGAKFDNVLVLEGKQGLKKSLALSTLGNINEMINHLETTMSAGNKDFFMSFVGKLIVEFSEGETLTRSETKQLKGIITTAYDNYREPYARKSKDHPRWCVFAMTTNEDTYLKDDTGNRRWLPVRVLLDECNIEWIKENREQLYAEAYHRVINLKETYWEFPKELLEEAQDERRVEDINADKVVDWYKNTLYPFERECGITVREVYDKVINKIDTVPYTPYEAIRIAGILKGSLKLTLKRMNENNSKVNKWFDVQNRHQSISAKPEEEKKEKKQIDEPYADEFVNEGINKITTQWEKII